MIQPSLFGESQTKSEITVTIDEAASNLCVSTATIRNWIKAGHLETLTNGQVTVSSIDRFSDEIAGTDKLVSRANKSLKDQHDNEYLSRQINQLLARNDVAGAELAQIYEQSLSESHKNREGIYYTPHEIVDRFFEYLPDDCSNLTFCDPCCGTGNFVVAAIKHGFRPENIYGFDIDPTAVQIARRRVEELTDSKNRTHILVKDFLEPKPDAVATCFNVIFTNPPWGKKIPKQQRFFLSRLLRTGSAQDTSAFFLFASLRHLSDGGFLGLLLQEAFFNIATFENARKIALEYDIKALIEFGKPFKGVIAKASGLILQKQSESNTNLVNCFVGNEQHKRTQESFRQNPKSIINFGISSVDSMVITHLNALEHVTLAGYAKYGLGIVTGNNKRFCSNQPRDGYLPVFRGSDIRRNGLKSASTFISQDMSQFQQVAPIELYQAKEKLIYKFISSDLVFFLDTEQRLILNSANMLILNDDFPITGWQLCQLLNSRLVNWYFRAVFNTHKVLQSDLETIPIHTEYFEKFDEFHESMFHEFLGIEEVADGTFRIKR